MIGSMFRDVRFALRSILRDRAFAVTSLASIGLGIAATAAVFAIVTAVYLRPLPYTDPSRLVMIWQDLRGIEPHWTVTPGNYSEWRRRSRSFDAMAAFNIDFVTIEGAQTRRRVLGSIVTPEFFEVLGVRAALGSTFRDEHGLPGNDRVVLISHGLWQRRFGGDPGVVGESMVVDGTAHEILGVLPADYRHPEPEFTDAQFWRPLAVRGEAQNFEYKYLRVIGRLSPGVSIEEARTEMGALARTLEREYPEFNTGYGVTLVSLRDELFGAARPAVRLLLAGNGFVLLLVIVNMAGLSVVRCQRRRREFGVRAALGASAPRLTRQVLTEALLIALGGAGIGLLIWAAASGVLETVTTEHLARYADLETGGTVLLLTLGIATVTGLAFGISPALVATRARLREWLLSGSADPGATRGARRAREAFTAVALGTTVVLSFASLLMLRSFVALIGTETGFEADNVLTVSATVPDDRYETPDEVIAVHRALLDELRRLPGATSVAAAGDLPFTSMNQNTSAGPVGATEEELVGTEFTVVSEGYFSLLEIRVVAGDVRLDAGGREARVVVNESLAARLWPGENPVGRSLQIADRDTLDIRVAGVVGDILDDGYDGAREPRIYLPHSLNPGRRLVYLLEARADAGDLAEPVRQAISRVDSRIILSNFRAMRDLVRGTVSGRRAVTLVLSVFSGLALVLAGVGIYGVASYNVVMRRKELGIRAALGAGRSALRRLVLSDALHVAAGGLALGVILTVPAAQFLRSMLFGVGPFDPASYVAVCSLLGATALLGSLVPARRATRVDPAETLRE